MEEVLGRGNGLVDLLHGPGQLAARVGVDVLDERLLSDLLVLKLRVPEEDQRLELHLHLRLRFLHEVVPQHVKELLHKARRLFEIGDIEPVDRPEEGVAL